MAESSELSHIIIIIIIICSCRACVTSVRAFACVRVRERVRTTDIGHSLAFPFITKLFSPPPPPPLPPRRLSSSGNLNGACADSQISGSQRVENFHRRFARRNTVRLSRARSPKSFSAAPKSFIFPRSEFFSSCRFLSGPAAK